MVPANFPDYKYSSKAFEVHILENCVPTSIDKTTGFEPNPLEYTVAENPAVASFTPSWATTPEGCKLDYKLTVKSSPSATFDPDLFKFIIY